MKVLFVGVTGAIGREVVPFLQPHFDLLLAARDEVPGHPVHAVDINDFDAITSFIAEARPDAVVNCAIADYREHQRNPVPEVRHRYNENMIETNVRGAYHLYEAAARAEVPKFVFVSSLSIVTGYPQYEAITGAEPPRPANFYACTKHFGEQVGELYAQRHEMSVTCLRLGQPYPDIPDRDARRLAHDGMRAHLVCFEDIATAMRLALHETRPFSCYHIVSGSDHPWVSPESTAPLGYTPAYHFTPEGPVKRA